MTVSFEHDATWENDEALIVEIAGEDREYITVFQRKLGVLDLEFWCKDEADAKELFWNLRDNLPKRFSVKTPTSASTRDLSPGNGSAAGS